ncbi:hypothetical protein BH11BAC7_BH11BAC7_22100 [soil metagenome]
MDGKEDGKKGTGGDRTADSVTFYLVVLFFLHFLRFSVGFEIGAVATVIFSMENKATFEAGACYGSNKKKGNKSFKAAHEEMICIKYKKKGA